MKDNLLKNIIVFFANLNKKEKVIFYFTAFIILVAVFNGFIIGPTLNKMRKLNKEIEKEKRIAKKSLHVLAQKDKIKKEKKLYSSYVEEVRSQEEDTVIFLQKLEDIANKSSVYLIDIKVSDISGEDIFKKYTARLTCEAQMEQLINFFYDVESSNQLLKIEHFDIRPKSSGSSVARSTVYISKSILLGEEIK